MRSAPVLLFALVVCAAAGVGHLLYAKAPIPPDGVPPESLKAVQGVLPKGWTASVKGTTITVRREKQIGLVNAVGADPGQELDNKPRPPDRTEVYEITLQFRPRVTAEKYEKMRKENDEIDKQLDAMRDKLRAAQIAHKFDDWLPDTPVQKKLVADYRAMQKAMPYHRLPDFYTETRSIDFADSVHPFLGFVDEAEAKECHGVKDKVRKLFKPHADH